MAIPSLRIRLDIRTQKIATKRKTRTIAPCIISPQDYCPKYYISFWLNMQHFS